MIFDNSLESPDLIAIKSKEKEINVFNVSKFNSLKKNLL